MRSPTELYAKWLKNVSLSIRKVWEGDGVRPGSVTISSERNTPRYDYHHVHDYSPAIHSDSTISAVDGWKNTMQITDADVLIFSEEPVDGFIPVRWSITVADGKVVLPFDEDTHTARLDMRSQAESGLSAEEWQKV